MRPPLTDIHPSAARLLEGARTGTAHLQQSRQIHTFLQLRAAMGISSANLTNWKQRGVSMEGAIQAETLWGCSASWVLTGKVPPRWVAAAATAADPVVASLDTLQAQLGQVPEDMRQELGEALSAWARRGGRDAYRRTVEALLDEASRANAGGQSRKRHQAAA